MGNVSFIANLGFSPLPLKFILEPLVVNGNVVSRVPAASSRLKHRALRRLCQSGKAPSHERSFIGSHGELRARWFKSGQLVILLTNRRFSSRGLACSCIWYLQLPSTASFSTFLTSLRRHGNNERHDLEGHVQRPSIWWGIKMLPDQRHSGNCSSPGHNRH